MTQTQPFPPPPPAQPVQEGARWRWHRPDGTAVAQWFQTQPLDEEMSHEHYVGGVVIIPQSEKVKYTNPDGRGTSERHEMVYTPYMQIGTRVAYFRRLAEKRGLIPVSRAAEVPRTINAESAYFNANMPSGLWWHVVKSSDGGLSRFLCATWRVALYERESYQQLLQSRGKGKDWQPLPVLEGTGTKQVPGGADINQIAKAQTGALGRALGVAGILVVGTGIASAEDMQEYTGPPVAAPGAAGAQLPAPTELPPGEQPEPADPAAALDALRARAMALQVEMQEQTPDAWRDFVAWWQERKQESGWDALQDVPFEALKGVVSRMEQLKVAAKSAAGGSE